MSKTLTITLPDALEQALAQTAAQANQSTEEMVVQLLTQTLMPNSESKSEEADPLMALFGCIKSDIPDLAERHDEYLGQALYEEMHRNE
jgi:plasmid stability protein